MEKINWVYKPFSELTANELYEILSLRNKVFVVEQSCVYDDTDYKDKAAWHLCGWLDKELVAYTRIIAPGVSYKEASIGRVVTNFSHRKKGIGIELMKLSIEKTCSQFGVDKITISAQLYLLSFYNSLDFVQIGEPYLEDDIPHIKMIWSN